MHSDKQQRELVEEAVVLLMFLETLRFVACIQSESKRPLNRGVAGLIGNPEIELVSKTELIPNIETFVKLLLILFPELIITGPDLILHMQVPPQVPPVAQDQCRAMGGSKIKIDVHIRKTRDQFILWSQLVIVMDAINPDKGRQRAQIDGMPAVEAVLSGSEGQCRINL